MKRIVIIGGGFGGIYTAKYLIQKYKNNKDVQITLVNKDNYFLFTPMLHEVATGGLNRHNVVEPIRSILHATNFEFVEDTVKNIDKKNKIVTCKECEIPFDYLVVAIGAKTNFFNIPGAKEHCLDLKDIHAAANVRNSIISSLEHASKGCAKKDRKKYLNFIVVGAGPTGVELSAEMAEFVKQMTARNYTKISPEQCNIYLVQRSKKIMPFIHSVCIDKATKELKKKDVTILCNSAVTKVFKDAVEINNTMKIPSDTIVWTSGVKPNTINTTPKLTNEKGFFEVNEHLQVKGTKNVFALGDVALFFNKGENKPVPALAQVATKQARIVADNIINTIENKPLLSCNIKLGGLLVSIGQKYGVADIHGFRFKGMMAWFLWRTVYLFKLVGTANKIRVAFDWTINLFSRRDTSQL